MAGSNKDIIAMEVFPDREKRFLNRTDTKYRINLIKAFRQFSDDETKSHSKYRGIKSTLEKMTSYSDLNYTYLKDAIGKKLENIKYGSQAGIRVEDIVVFEFIERFMHDVAPQYLSKNITTDSFIKMEKVFSEFISPNSLATGEPPHITAGSISEGRGVWCFQTIEKNSVYEVKSKDEKDGNLYFAFHKLEDGKVNIAICFKTVGDTKCFYGVDFGNSHTMILRDMYQGELRFICYRRLLMPQALLGDNGDIVRVERGSIIANIFSIKYGYPNVEVKKIVDVGCLRFGFE